MQFRDDEPDCVLKMHCSQPFQLNWKIKQTMFKNLLVARVKVAPYLISVLLFNKIKVNFRWKCELIVSFAGSAGYFLFFFLSGPEFSP